MPLYCSNCDSAYWYEDFRGRKPLCPKCKSWMKYYRHIEDAPVWHCCANCTIMFTTPCTRDHYLRVTPKAPFYPNNCPRFVAKRHGLPHSPF
jgi:hypothetical protein